ncbi:hypothetical protein [Nostoc sp. C110]|uniref:hypothetical protein n=1 Tax=Nostoc sp. C110 TaxID=3349876 RepID=UPI00370D4A7A
MNVAIASPFSRSWSNHSTAWLMRHRLELRAVLMDLMAGVEIQNLMFGIERDRLFCPLQNAIANSNGSITSICAPNPST